MLRKKNIVHLQRLIVSEQLFQRPESVTLWCFSKCLNITFVFSTCWFYLYVGSGDSFRCLLEPLSFMQQFCVWFFTGRRTHLVMYGESTLFCLKGSCKCNQVIYKEPHSAAFSTEPTWRKNTCLYICVTLYNKSLSENLKLDPEWNEWKHPTLVCFRVKAPCFPKLWFIWLLRHASLRTLPVFMMLFVTQ